MTKTHLLPTFYSSANRPQPHRYIYSASPDNLMQRADAASEREMVGRVGFSGSGSIGILRRLGEKKSEFIPSVERLYRATAVEYLYVDEQNEHQVARISLLETPPPSYLVKSFNPSQRLEYLSNFKIRQQFARSLERDAASEKPRRCAKGLTLRGKRIIANGCSLLEYKYGVRGIGFYTLTCPYTDPYEIQHFNDCYPEIIRRYMQEVKRIYERNGDRFTYVGVYEVQPERYTRTGDACLHFHYVARAKDDNRRFYLSHSAIVALYRGIVVQVTGIEFDGNPRCSAELVRSSSAGYLSKYFSKSQPVDASGEGYHATVSLSTWYSVSRAILVATKRTTLELPGHISDELFRCGSSGLGHELCKWLKPIFKVWDGVSRCVGVVFSLVDDYVGVLRSLTFPDVEHLL